MAAARYNLKRGKRFPFKRKQKVKGGDTIVVYRGGRRSAEVRILPTAPKGQRPIGLAKGLVEMHPSFFDPMTEDFLSYFEVSPDERSG